MPIFLQKSPFLSKSAFNLENLVGNMTKLISNRSVNVIFLCLKLLNGYFRLVIAFTKMPPNINYLKLIKSKSFYLLENLNNLRNIGLICCSLMINKDNC